MRLSYWLIVLKIEEGSGLTKNKSSVSVGSGDFRLLLLLLLRAKSLGSKSLFERSHKIAHPLIVQEVNKFIVVNKIHVGHLDVWST